MSAWIKWEGGECPVDPETRIMLRLRGPSVWDAGGYIDPAGNFDWHHKGSKSDIIAYRVVAS